MRCLESMIITEILRLREMNFTFREIADATKVSKTSGKSSITSTFLV